MALGSPMVMGTMADWSRTQVRAARNRRARSASSWPEGGRRVVGGDGPRRPAVVDGVGQVVAGDDGHGIGLELDPRRRPVPVASGERTIRMTPSGSGGACWLLRLPTMRSE